MKIELTLALALAFVVARATAQTATRPSETHAFPFLADTVFWSGLEMGFNTEVRLWETEADTLAPETRDLSGQFRLTRSHIFQHMALGGTYAWLIESVQRRDDGLLEILTPEGVFFWSQERQKIQFEPDGLTNIQTILWQTDEKIRRSIR